MTILSRYSTRYPRALVYMLQASEYKIDDYLKWYYRTTDFRRVEYRKHLDKTAKAKLLLAVAWLESFAIALLVAALLWFGLGPTASPVWLMVAVLVLALAPTVVAYGLLLPLVVGRVVIQRPKELKIIAEAHAVIMRHEATKIAVAGSYGKTTFKDTLATVLAAGFAENEVRATPGNLNTPIGISRFVGKLTGQEKVLIFELGEYYPGDVQGLAEFVEPSMGIIAGINEAHLSKFKTLDATVGTIFELADFLGDRPCYKNGESALTANRAGPDPLLYTRKGMGDWVVEAPISGLDGLAFTAHRGKVKVHVKSGLLGLHQIGPLVAMIDIAFSLGLSPTEIEIGLAATGPFEHRLQPRIDQGGVVTIDDSYNGNPDGARVAIEVLAGLSGHRRFYVTPGLVEMGDRTPEVHREIGRQLAKAKIEVVVLIRNSASIYIAEGLVAAKYAGRLIWYDDALVGLAALPSLTAAGDVVLLQNDWPDAYA